MGVAVDFCQKTMQNKHASLPFIVPVLVLANTPPHIIEANIRANTALDLPWMKMSEAHSGVAILCGGGPSLAEDIEAIRKLQAEGGTVFAMNAASQFLRGHGIECDWQMMVDAKPETAHLVDLDAKAHLIASQCDPDTVKRATRATLWHVYDPDIESLFPPEKVKAGGYALTSGGISVGNCAPTLVYAMGFRQVHCFGYDSSHRDGASHAYSQPMNKFITNVEVEWGGKVYTCSVAMKAQAEKFQLASRQLVDLGCEITVHGSGLLPAMWNTSLDGLTERDKYRLMWQTALYRCYSPGEMHAVQAETLLKPHGMVIDFGCGTGRASLVMHRLGHQVHLVDFADNCRDPEALALPFTEWDLTKPGLPLKAPHGICCDVMEHIEPENVNAVIRNIMDCADEVFFQISTIEDKFGAMIGGAPLHLTVESHGHWLARFVDLGYSIRWHERDDNSSRMVIANKAASQTGAN